MENEMRIDVAVSGILAAGFGLASVFCFLKARKERNTQTKRKLNWAGTGCAVVSVASGAYFCWNKFLRKEPSPAELRRKRMQAFKKNLFAKYVHSGTICTEIYENPNKVVSSLYKHIDRFCVQEDLDLGDKVELQNEILEKWKRKAKEIKKIDNPSPTDDRNNTHFEYIHSLFLDYEEVKKDNEELEKQRERLEQERLIREAEEKRKREEEAKNSAIQDALKKHKDFDDLVIQVAKENDQSKINTLLGELLEGDWKEAQKIKRLASLLRENKANNKKQIMVDQLKVLGDQIGAECRADQMFSALEAN
jgi:hypothetical protein